MGVAFIFPGLNGLLRRSDRLRYADHPRTKDYFVRAESVLREGFGTEVRLREFLDRSTDEIYRVEQISVAAVAIVCMQSAISELVAEKIGDPDWTMGCSLGDLGRSIFAGAYRFEDAIFNHVHYTRSIDGIDKIGANIGVLASRDKPFNDEDYAWLEKIEVDVSRLTPRFLNVGGRLADLEKIRAVSKEKGWNTMRILDYPAHSRYILPYVERVSLEVLRIDIRAPRLRMFSSFSAQPLTDPEVVKREFLLSMTMPIHWSKAVETLVANHGIKRFVNVGPCKSLSGLMRDIPVDVETLEASELLA